MVRSEICRGHFALGYDGTSIRIAKAIREGIANGCLLEKRRRNGERVCSRAEDLCNLGPVALLSRICDDGLCLHRAWLNRTDITIIVD